MAVVTAYVDQVQKAYIAYYGRPADTGGLDFWTNQLSAVSGNWSSIINAFGNSAEATGLLANMTTAQKVNNLYHQLFGRDADLAGLQFYVGKINDGTYTLASLAVNIMNGTQAGSDATALQAKLDSAKLFTNSIDTTTEYLAYDGATAAAAARTWLSGVTTVAADQTSVNALMTTLTTATTPGNTYTLTTGIDIITGTLGNDTFDGSVNAQGTATLTSVDVLDGGGGNDTLIAEMTGATIAPTVKHIEAIEIIGGGSAASTFNMINVTDSPSVLVRNSSQKVTVDSYAGNTITLRDQAADLDVNMTNAAATGATAFTLNLSGAQKGAGNGPTVTLAQMAGADTSGVETVTVHSEGTNSNYLTALVDTKMATLTVTGNQTLTVSTALGTSVKTFDASASAGVSASFSTTGVITLSGGAGNDSLTLTNNTANTSITAGAGNDTVSFTTGFDTNDTVNAGDGVDRLDITAANAEAITSALTNTTNFEQLSLNTATTGGSSINATRFGTIDTVRLDKGTGGAYGVTMAAGTQNLTIAEPTAATNATLGGLLTVTDTGTATTDVINITNRDTDTASATNNFAGAAITSAGYETVNINTGSAVTAAQTIGVITITGDSTSTAQTINLSGANALTIGAPSSNSSGLFTINASGMTAQAAGTATFTMSAPTFAGVTGTVSIVGSAGQDVLLGHTTAANTIDGGAGVDTVTGGAAADSLLGGAGNDSITGGGGNDTVFGNDGNDTIVMTTGTVSVDGGAGNDTVNMAATLSAGDIVVGGDGTDTLMISTAAVTAGAATGVSGFETLTFDATGGANQDLVQFINNSTFTRVNFGATANNTQLFSNASASVATLGLGNVDLTAGTFTRLVDTSADTLAISASSMSAARTVTALTIANEETVSIATATSGNGDLTITTLTADDLTSLTITGASDVEVTNAIVNAANLATINAVAATGTIKLVASTSVANMTITGSLAAGNTITGGTGSDTITGGDVADSLTGGNGADSIIGGGGDDSLLGGIGADTILGGIGADVITGGVGNDVLTGGDGADIFTFTTKTTEGVDSITDFVVGTDKINVAQTISDATITAAAAQGALSDAKSYYISTNGAAANLTTGGSATLNVADLTATTLTNLAAYLSERFVPAAGANSILAINWTAGANNTTYLYDITDDGGATSVAAAELTLIGVVTRAAGTVMVAGDLT